MRSLHLGTCLSFSMLAAALSGCKTTSANYADPDKVEIVGDGWNESDARLLSERMIKSALSKRWLPEWRAERQHQGTPKPFVIVGDFENRTSESRLDTKAVFEAVRDELISSGQVRFLDGEQRMRLLEEYRYQGSGVVSSQSAKQPGHQHGADFFLIGSLSSIVAQADGYKTVTYQLEMRLTNVETSEIVWTQVEKIKKQIRRGGFGA